MQESKEISLKQDLFVQLAFTLFCHIVGKQEGTGEIISKSAAFATTPEGGFFLLGHTPKDFDIFPKHEEVLLTILKEGKSVADMWDIQVWGELSTVSLEDYDTLKVAKKLFEDKSPYLGTVGFLDLDKNYVLLQLMPKRIFFQNLGKQREGVPSYTLLKS